MMYQFREGYAEGFATGKNRGLSEIDKQWIHRYYFPVANLRKIDNGDYMFESSEVTMKLDDDAAPTWKLPYIYDTPRSEPTFSVGITSFDSEDSSNAHVECKVEPTMERDHETKKEFNCGYVTSISTNRNAAVKSASCTWFECPEASKGLIYTDHKVLQDQDPDTPDDTVLKKKISFKFPKSFSTKQPPAVVLWINKFTLKNASKPAINARIISSSNQGFTVEVEAVGRTLQRGIGFDWIAYPPGTPRLCSGSLNTQHTNGSIAREGEVVFSSSFKYLTAPKVMLAFTSFDFEGGKRLSARLQVVKTIPSGFLWALETQTGTEINGFGAMYLALGDVDSSSKIQS